MHRASRTACFFTLLTAFWLAPGVAAADDQADLAEIGKKLSNPVSDVWALFTEFDFSFNDGDINTGDDRVSYSMNFQPIMPIKLTEDWKIIMRPSVPFSFSQQVPSFGSGGVSFDQVTGLGDIKLPLPFSPKWSPKLFGGHLVGGAGPTWSFPTATDRRLGSKQFEVGPAAVLVWKNPKWTVGIFPQYFFSFASVNGSQPETSSGELLYFVFRELPNAWQIGFNPVITFDAKASSGDKWNIPIGLTVAKTTRIGKMPVKFQLGAEYSVVSQDNFGKRWLIKLNIIPVIPDLIKNTLF